jgi:peptide chain release factor subunit 1
MTVSDPTRVLRRLARIKPGRHPVVSCYIKLEPRDRARGKYLIKFRNRLKELERSLEWLVPDRKEREVVRGDIERVREFMTAPSRLPATQGLAIFASKPLGLFEVVPLPRVYRSRLAVDRSAFVRELAALEDEVGRLLTVVVDRTSARIFEVSAFEAREVASLRAPASTRGGKYHSDRQDAPGRGEHGYHNRIRQERQRHLESVARALFERDRAEPAHGLVIAGPGPEATALEPFLHPYLGERLLGAAHLNPREATPALVHAATVAVREAFRREAQHDLLHELEEGEGRGWAVNGVAETLRALSRGQVRTLLVNGEFGCPGYRMSGTGRLTLEAPEGRSEGEAVPVLDVVDDAIEEALRQGVGVEVLHDAPANTVVGTAALLRFR